MSDANIEQVRATAQKLAERVKSDPAFKHQVEKDPLGTLTAAGLPGEAVSQFLREAELTEVAGYRADCVIGSCLLGSCIILSE